MNPLVDLVVLTRRGGPLVPEVERGIGAQEGVRILVHRVVGEAKPDDRRRWDAIARARNVGKALGTAPWLMFLDDDVVLDPQCVATLVEELRERPVYGAWAADYLGERHPTGVSPHVAMGATMFRRQALDEIRFTWRGSDCECQCCCDDLRRRHWGIDYSAVARARHLPKGEVGKSAAADEASPRALHAHAAGAPSECSSALVPSVCLVTCYFGKLPGWIDLHLLSCAHNPSIDFLFVTDQEDFPIVPRNVRVVRMNASSFCTLAEMTVGERVALSHPRKLCDFKPLYGDLFKEHLDGWDYWGYADLDVIYGDVRHFLSTMRLHEYDVFTAREEFLVGHFTLFRNNDRLRALYQESIDYRAALRNSHVMSFDECGKEWGRRLQGKPLSDRATCDSMTHVVHRLMGEGKISACFAPAVVEWPELGAEGWRLTWRAGRLWIVDQRREAMYCHFHGFKRRRGFREPCPLDGDLAFEISPNGFRRASVRAGRRANDVSRAKFRAAF